MAAVWKRCAEHYQSVRPMDLEAWGSAAEGFFWECEYLPSLFGEKAGTGLDRKSRKQRLGLAI